MGSAHQLSSHQRHGPVDSGFRRSKHSKWYPLAVLQASCLGVFTGLQPDPARRSDDDEEGAAPCTVRSEVDLFF